MTARGTGRASKARHVAEEPIEKVDWAGGGRLWVGVKEKKRIEPFPNEQRYFFQPQRSKESSIQM